MPKKEPLEIIHLLSRAISQAAKLEEVYDIMLDELVNTFGVERASIMHFQPKSQTLKIVAARGMDPEIWKNVSIPMGEGVSGAAFSKAKPVLIKKKKAIFFVRIRNLFLFVVYKDLLRIIVSRSFLL